MKCGGTGAQFCSAQPRWTLGCLRRVRREAKKEDEESTGWEMCFAFSFLMHPSRTPSVGVVTGSVLLDAVGSDDVMRRHVLDLIMIDPNNNDRILSRNKVGWLNVWLLVG